MSLEGPNSSGDDRMSIEEIGQDVPPSYGEATGEQETVSPGSAALAAVALAAGEKKGLLGDDASDEEEEEEEEESGEAGHGAAEEGGSAAGPSSSSPPNYARHDPSARTYLLKPPLVYSSTSTAAAAAATNSAGAQTPAYQLCESRASSGRPSQLGIRPLQPSESMRLSLTGLVGENELGHKTPTVRYDEDTALYSIRSMSAFSSPRYEIESPRGGGGGRTLPGHVLFEAPGFSPTALPGGIKANDSGRFWHMTKKRTGTGAHSLQPDKEWDQKLLFSMEKKGSLGGWRAARSCEWRDQEGKLLAVEGRGGVLELTEELLVGGPYGGATGGAKKQAVREALLTCWVGKVWASGKLECPQP